MIHAMKSTLREQQQAETRERILQAFLDLAHESNAINISVPDVAQKSGVSVRTIYRYFATKDELQTAAAYQMSSQALGGRDIYQTNASSLHEYLKDLWISLAAAMPAVLAEHTSPAGRAIRRVRLHDARDTVARALPETHPGTVDLIVAVTSSSMLMELVDRMGYSPEEAAQIAADLALVIAGSTVGSNVERPLLPPIAESTTPEGAPHV